MINFKIKIKINKNKRYKHRVQNQHYKSIKMMCTNSFNSLMNKINFLYVKCNYIYFNTNYNLQLGMHEGLEYFFSKEKLPY